ncbi:MAG: sigma-70 family RNA polymerase sigma factor [Solirubrobacterales bacterium]|nr:sigma-70 family RNA polymerase sigma factor [Solirubrobacterales bacterium]
MTVVALPTGGRRTADLWVQASGMRSRGEARHIHEVIARARNGDREALGELYERYAESVFYCVHRILQDVHEAEDVTQHVFLKLMSVLPRYQRREVPFSAWLMRVARNVALDAERKRRPMRYEDIDESDPDELDHYQRGRSLREALAALPATQRRVVVLRHVVGLSAPEVAEHLGKTAGSVHALDQRGRRTLQGDLAELGWAPATASGSDRNRVALA